MKSNQNETEPSETGTESGFEFCKSGFGFSDYSNIPYIKPGTHDASKHANCLADGVARTPAASVCASEVMLVLTSIEHASMLAYARKLKIFKFFWC